MRIWKFSDFLSDELEVSRIWHKVVVDKYPDGEYVIFIFRHGAAVKAENVPADKAGKSFGNRRGWQWHGEAGRAVEAAADFMNTVGDEKLPQPTKCAAVRKARKWTTRKVPDMDRWPIEAALAGAMLGARTRPKTTRVLNEDGSVKCVVFSFAKGAEIELHEDRTWRLRGDLGTIYAAVKRAGKAFRRYRDELDERQHAEGSKKTRRKLVRKPVRAKRGG